MSVSAAIPGEPRVAVYCADLGGGVAQVALAQIDILSAAGYAVDLVLNHAGDSPYSGRVPKSVRIIPLTLADDAAVAACLRRSLRGHPVVRFRSRFISHNRLMDMRYLPAVVGYLEHEQPVIFFANVWNMALIAGCASACVERPPRLIGIFHGTFFAQAIQRRSVRRHPWQWRHFFAFCRHFYSRADALVTVSDGVGRDLVRIVGVAANRVETLPNPVVSPAPAARAAEPVDDAWLAAGAPPLIVAVGRLSPEKNFSLLLQALARLRVLRPGVRLAVLGEGDERTRLEVLRDELDLNDCVSLPGWVDNPGAWMARAALVALSSDWEGLPTVLIEALACGCPVVATDCSHGPRDILDNGRYGRLVPMQDADAMAVAMANTIDAPRDSQALIAHAQRYSVDAAARRYRALVDRVLGAS